MRMTARDGSLELFGDYRRGSSRKPPRPHARRRRCVSEDVRRSGGGQQRLTTFQKLDREMGRFVKAQNARGVAKQDANSASGSMQVSEEDSSVRGVRHGVKWNRGWMIEQDSLYWETVRRQNASAGDAGENSSWRRAQAADAERGLLRAHDNNSSVSTCDSECDGALRHHCSTDHESVSSGMELHLRRSHASARRTRRQQADSKCPRGPESLTAQEQENNISTGGEDIKLPHPRPEKGWPAVLQAKCEVLQMEKELADQRLQQQSAEMAQAAEMAHCLRASVQTILETAKRGTVSAPCTPGRHLQEDYSPCLQQRIQRLQTVNVQRDLEDQAKSFQNRLETLRLQSQIRSRDSSFRNDRISKTRLSSTSSTTQVLTSDGEDWAQVQEVLKQLRGKTGSLQYSCENWEKRAIFAESKAASLQIEEEKWRVEAQKSEEKVRELERELVQVRATLEEVRNRHALEQSRLLGSGSNHGYTLVLQPIVTTSTQGRHPGCLPCTTTSPDCESCGLHWHGSDAATLNYNHQPATVTEDLTHPREVDVSNLENFAASENGDEIICANDEPDAASPDRDVSETASAQSGSGARHRYEGALDVDDSPTHIPTKTATAAAAAAGQPEPAKTEVEKSLSQKWFKQRPKSRRPGASTRETTSMSETRSNLGNGPIPAKALHRKGVSGQNAGASIQKPGPVYAGSMRVSSPSSLLEKRVPLREIKRNTSASGDITNPNAQN